MLLTVFYKHHCKALLPVVVVLLQACANNYSAPVTDQGSPLLVQPPVIVDNSTPDSVFRAERGAPTVSSSNATVSSSRSRSAAAASPQLYRVRSGDTLFSIAYQYDLDFRSLAIANGLNPPYTIFVDQELNLDVSRIRNSNISSSTLGTAVGNNSVARSQPGVNRSGGVLRQPIEAARATEPNWRWPHSGQLLRQFQSGNNEGIDLAGQVGDPVLAAAAGDVVYSGAGVQGSGNLIIIRHNDRYLSAYAHNSVMLVAEGSHVAAGDKIAELGQNPAGVPMLHFEVRVEGKSIDPTTLLPRR